MEKYESKIITCEKCFHIPKIIFLNKNKVHIQCSNCQFSNIEDISYFEKYISSKKFSRIT